MNCDSAHPPPIFNSTINIAINYWGMTRSTRFVYKSHHEKLFDVLKKCGINYDIYMHTWKTDKNIVWGDEVNIPINYEEYQLLTPTHYQIDEQSLFLESINFEDYFNQKIYDLYGGDTYREWRPYLIRNHLCALESQKRVTTMCINSNKKYDFVIYIRPDVEIQTAFPIDCLSKININDIAIPADNHYEGYNDRFAIIPFSVCEKYGKRIDEIIEFRNLKGRIVSEKYVKYIIEKYYDKVHFINFNFQITRPK